MKVYVLLKYYNLYDQEGGYFCGVFGAFKDAIGKVKHLGRLNNEDEWYIVEEVPLNRLTGVFEYKTEQKEYSC